MSDQIEPKIGEPGHVASLKPQDRPEAVASQKRLEEAVFREKAKSFDDELRDHYNWLAKHAGEIATSQKGGPTEASFKMYSALKAQEAIEDDIKRPFDLTEETLRKSDEITGLFGGRREFVASGWNRIKRYLETNSDVMGLVKKRGLTKKAYMDGVDVISNLHNGQLDREIREEGPHEGWEFAIEYVGKQLKRVGLTPQEQETHLLIMTVAGELSGSYLLELGMEQVAKVKGENIKDTYTRYKGLMRELDGIIGTW